MTKPQALTPVEQAALTDQRGRPLDIPEIAKGLTPRQLAFASLVAHGHSFKAAVILAGYSCSTDASAKNFGSQLASDERIAAVVQHFTAALLKSTAPRALKVMSQIMQDPEARDADRIKAAGKVLDKVLPTRTSHEVEGHLKHEHHVVQHTSPDLHRLYAEAGLTPPPHALGAPAAPVIDAEFVELEPVSAAPAEDDVWGV